MGDETHEQTGAAPANTMGPREIAAALKNIKLAPGFKIDVYASGVNSARQMAWGDKGTLFVGSFSVGTVYAIVDEGGKKQVKAILKGLKMPTGVAFRDGALYVADIDKIYKIAAPYGKVRPAHARATAFRRYLRANLK
jgi:glucose/arabinose dehydrogenase